MLTELLRHFTLPVLLLVVLAAGFFLGRTVEELFNKLRRNEWRRKNKSRWKNGGDFGAAASREPITRLTDSADQLRIVMKADFEPQPLLNKGEARVFKELDRIVISINSSWQVMAQVSLGEILRCQDQEAYSCINSKRVDLLLMDWDCHPRHAIEYQGGGHHQGTAAARDAVKREALRRAGIGYHEVVAGHTTPTDLRRLVERLVDKPGSLQN